MFRLLVQNQRAEVAVTGISALSCLGSSIADHQRMMDSGRNGLRPLRELAGLDSRWSDLPAGWLEPRSPMHGNRYGPASNLALAAARAALQDAALPGAELRHAWLFVGTSRGNAAGSLAPWPGRRSHSRMAASNSMHSELAAAISIELGIHGPYQVLSNGCTSGLDALGLAWSAVASGVAPRAIVVSADLPLVPQILDNYVQTGLLSHNGVNDPYSPKTSGFLPAEGAAALVLEPAQIGRRPAYAEVLGYWANSDAYDALRPAPEGAGLVECLKKALSALGNPVPEAICVHASGTLAHGQAERKGLEAVFGPSKQPISLHLLKPFTGHTIGASGALDSAILLHYLKQGFLPPNLPGLAGEGGPFTVPPRSLPLRDGLVLKLSAGMGGQNAVVAFAPARPTILKRG